MTTPVPKKFPFRKVPRAELFDPVSSPANPDSGDEEPVDDVSPPSSEVSPDEVVESVGDVSPPSNDVSPDAVDALVADVLLAWATAAACPATPPTLVVCGGALNGVSWAAVAEAPA